MLEQQTAVACCKNRCKKRKSETQHVGVAAGDTGPERIPAPISRECAIKNSKIGARNLVCRSHLLGC
eukprot:6176564-Pleurochrysis_carterae.AAC.1